MESKEYQIKHPHSEGEWRAVDLENFFNHIGVPVAERHYYCEHKIKQEWHYMREMHCSGMSACAGMHGQFYGYPPEQQHDTWNCAACANIEIHTHNKAWYTFCKNYKVCKGVRNLLTGEGTV